MKINFKKFLIYKILPGLFGLGCGVFFPMLEVVWFLPNLELHKIPH